MNNFFADFNLLINIKGKAAERMFESSKDNGEIPRGGSAATTPSMNVPLTLGNPNSNWKKLD